MARYWGAFLAFATIALPLMMFWIVILHLLLGITKPEMLAFWLAIPIAGLHMWAALAVINWATE